MATILIGLAIIFNKILFAVPSILLLIIGFGVIPQLFAKDIAATKNKKRLLASGTKYEGKILGYKNRIF